MSKFKSNQKTKEENKDYTIINADCMDVFKSMPENFVDAVVCDPPYSTTSYGMSGLGGRDYVGTFGKGKPFKMLDINLYLKELYRVMKPMAHGYLMTNQKNLKNFLNAFDKLKSYKTDEGFTVFKVLVWDKKSKITNRYYMEQIEFIIFFRKGRAKGINDAGTSNILSFANIRTPSDSKFQWHKIHPTIKPTQLLRTLIMNSTKKGDIVLDFTMGSGSTGVAALSLERKFIGIQIDPKYYEEAKRRVIYFDENVKTRKMTPEQALEADESRLSFRIDKKTGRRFWWGERKL